MLNNNDETKQNAEASASTAEVKDQAKDIIEQTTMQLTKYVNKLAETEMISVKDSTVKDLVTEALQQFKNRMDKENN